MLSDVTSAPIYGKMGFGGDEPPQDGSTDGVVTAELIPIIFTATEVT